MQSDGQRKVQIDGNHVDDGVLQRPGLSSFVVSIVGGCR